MQFGNQRPQRRILWFPQLRLVEAGSHKIILPSIYAGCDAVTLIRATPELPLLTVNPLRVLCGYGQEPAKNLLWTGWADGDAGVGFKF